jgi:DNA-binding IclR family transcriptional regulator
LTRFRAFTSRKESTVRKAKPVIKNAHPDRPLERYIRILEIVASFARGIGGAQLADILSLPKSTMHRLLKSLVDAGALSSSEGRSPLFTLGPRILHIFYAGTSNEMVEKATNPLLTELARKTGESCFIARLNNYKITCVATVVPNNPVQVNIAVGREIWSHTSASSKAILAFQSEDVVRRTLPTKMPALTGSTKIRTTDVLKEYRDIRKSGIAISVGEYLSGFGGIACPVHLPSVGVIYSLSITGTIDSLINKNQRRYERLLKEYAPRVAEALNVHRVLEPI